MSKKKIILSIVGAIGVAILGAVGLIVKNKVTGGKGKKGDITYARLGIDKKNANVDELIGALEKHAIRWRKDATWWGLTAPNVRPDGTVDLTKSDGGRVTVKFVSVSGVQSHSKRKRRDSIKEYTMFDRGARAPKIIGAKKVWKDFKPIPIPDCKIGNLVAALNKRGFKDGTVKIRFDTRFAFASGWAWTVESKDKAIDGYYSMNDCSFVKARPGAK